MEALQRLIGEQLEIGPALLWLSYEPVLADDPILGDGYAVAEQAINDLFSRLERLNPALPRAWPAATWCSWTGGRRPVRGRLARRTTEVIAAARRHVSRMRRLRPCSTLWG